MRETLLDLADKLSHNRVAGSATRLQEISGAGTQHGVAARLARAVALRTVAHVAKNLTEHNAGTSGDKCRRRQCTPQVSDDIITPCFPLPTQFS